MIGNYEVWWTVAMVKVEDQGLTERSWRVPWPSRAKGGQAKLVPRSRSGSQQPPPTLHYPINTAAGVCIRDCRGIHWYYQDIMCHQPGPGQCVETCCNEFPGQNNVSLALQYIYHNKNNLLLHQSLWPSIWPFGCPFEFGPQGEPKIFRLKLKSEKVVSRYDKY